MTDLGHGQAAYCHFAERVRIAAVIGTCIKTKGNQMNDQFDSLPIPDICIDERLVPLFIARATLRELIAGLEALATGETAR